jgi:hypothetical protein
VQDIMTDAICDEVPFRISALSGAGAPIEVGGTVHEGFLRAAQTLAVELYEPVKAALQRNPGYQLACTGHSAGGACATLLAMIYSQLPALRERNVRGYSFGAPCCMSGDLANAAATRERVTSVIIGDDVIARLSLASTEGLFQSINIVTASGAERLSAFDKSEQLERVRVATRARRDRMFPGGLTFHIPELNRVNPDSSAVLGAEIVDPVLSFDRIVLSPKFMSAHLPSRYVHAIRHQVALQQQQHDYA